MVDVIALRVFYEFVNDLSAGDVFTIPDALDYIRSRVPKHTPNGVTIGHMAKQHPRVYRITENTHRITLYGVI